MTALMAISIDGDDAVRLPAPRPKVAVIAEKSRINVQIARAVSMELLRRGDSQKRQLDMELMPTDWILKRWAASVGDGLPSAKWDDAKSSPPPELDPETAILVDRLFLAAPPEFRLLATTWYKTTEPMMSMANRFGVTEGGLYARWRRMLAYFRQSFLIVGMRV